MVRGKHNPATDAAADAAAELGGSRDVCCWLWCKWEDVGREWGESDREDASVAGKEDDNAAEDEEEEGAV